MKKQIIAIVLPILLLTLTAATIHKFHIALHLITSRIHIEDLNKALEKKYQKKITIESENSSAEELLLKEYLSNRFSIKVNGQVKPLNFLSKEIDGDELVCYWNIKNISKISHLEVNNSILIECFSDQQNMINVTVLGAKKSFLLTNSTTSKTLKY